MNANKFNALTSFLLPLMFGLQVVTLILGTYLYLENADLRQSDNDILMSLADLKKEIKSSGFEKKSLLEKQTESSEKKYILSEDLAILNGKIAELSKLIEAQPSDKHDAIGEDHEYAQEHPTIEPKELFSNEYSDYVDADLILIKDEISNQFFHEEMDGVQLNSIECRARSCRVDLNLSSSDMMDVVQHSLATHIGRNHSFEIDHDDSGQFIMYFSVDE